MQTSNLLEIRNPELKQLIIKRTGSEEPNPQGLCCPNCEAREVYADPQEPNNSEKWSWIIRAFRIDDMSECRNCNNWFRC